MNVIKVNEGMKQITRPGLQVSKGMEKLFLRQHAA
jgi:hypothetical protein